MQVRALAPDPAQAGVHGALAQRHRLEQEGGQTQHCSQGPPHRHLARSGEAREDSEHHPADDVVGHARGHCDLAEVAPHQAQLRQDPSDDGQRRHRQRRGHEQREHRAVGATADEVAGQQQPRHQASGKGHDEAEAGHQRGGAAQASYQGQVCLEPGCHQQQRHPQPGDREQGSRGDLLVRDEPLEPAGPDRAEHRGPEDHPRGQLADHRRQPDPAHRVARCPRSHHQHQQLGPEDEQGVLVERRQHVVAKAPSCRSTNKGAWSLGGSSLGPLRSLRSMSTKPAASATGRVASARSMRIPLRLWKSPPR